MSTEREILPKKRNTVIPLDTTVTVVGLREYDNTYGHTKKYDFRVDNLNGDDHLAPLEIWCDFKQKDLLYLGNQVKPGKEVKAVPLYFNQDWNGAKFQLKIRSLTVFYLGFPFVDKYKINEHQLFDKAGKQLVELTYLGGKD